jgi:hypothetical protein
MFLSTVMKDISRPLRAFLLTLLAVVSPAAAEERVLITELMKNPVGASDAVPGDASHEFIELTNIGTDTFFVDSLFLFDNPGGVDSVVVWNPDIQGALPMHSRCRLGARACPPGACAIILDPDYGRAVAENPSCGLPVDSLTTVWTIDDNSFGSGGLSDNDGISMYKGTRKSIVRRVAWVSDRCDAFSLSDTIRQTAPRPPEGVSLVARLSLFCPPSFSSCPITMSPGRFENLSSGWLAESECRVSESDSAAARCTLAVIKAGGDAAPGATWSIVRSTGQSSAVIKRGVFEAFPRPLGIAAELRLDSAFYQFKIEENGRVIAWPLDLSPVWTPPAAIKISEVFPRGKSDVPEWFEIVNTSTMPVTLQGWRYGDFESSCVLTDDAVTLEPGGFLAVTKDKKLFTRNYPALSGVCEPPVWLSLDNSRDTLCLWNGRGLRCETVAYSAAWFDRWTDQSLERVSLQRDGTARDAWTPALRPSPGQPNASVPFRSADKPGLEIGPTRFTPNGDGVDDLLSIRLSVPAAFTAAVAIYGFNGKKYFDLPLPLARCSFWNGKTSAGAPAPAGPFFVVATFKSGEQTTVIRKKGILWR